MICLFLFACTVCFVRCALSFSLVGGGERSSPLQLSAACSLLSEANSLVE